MTTPRHLPRALPVPLTAQVAAVQLSLAKLREGGVRETDSDAHRRALEAAALTLEYNAKLDRLVGEIVSHRLADLVLDRLVETARGYAETALAVLGDGACLAAPRELALEVAETAISHLLHDLTGGALPQLVERLRLSPGAVESARVAADERARRALRASVARTSAAAERAVSSGEYDRPFTVEAAQQKLTDAILAGDLAPVDAGNLARYVIEYEGEGEHFAAALRVLEFIRDKAAAVPLDEFCKVCGRRRGVQVCADCLARESAAIAVEKGEQA